MFFRLFLTDLKRIKQRFLPLVLITLILAVGLSVVVLLSNRLLYNEQTIEPVNVGLVADASSPYAKMAYSMVSEMDSYRATCHFIEIASEDHGRQMLANDQIKALIIIPDNIINSIIYGEDNPITVIYNQDGTLETYTLNEVFKSTSSMLATAQAATTIIYQGAYQMGLPDTALDQIATDADNLYMDYVLSRTELYIREDLQLTGAYTPYQYYIVSGLLLLLFFSGIVFLSFIKGNSDTLRLRLKLHGITGAHIIISQYLTLTITLFMIYTILLYDRRYDRSFCPFAVSYIGILCRNTRDPVYRIRYPADWISANRIFRGMPAVIFDSFLTGLYRRRYCSGQTSA